MEQVWGPELGVPATMNFWQRTSGPPKWVFKLEICEKFLPDQLCNSCSSVLQMCVCVCVCVCVCAFVVALAPWNLQLWVAGAVLNPFLGSQFWAHFGVIIWDPSM